MRNNNRRVLITGIGIMTPYTNTLDEIWNKVVKGDSCLTRLEELEEQANIILGRKENPKMIAGSRFNEINLKEYLSIRDAREQSYDNTTKLALISSQRAINNAEIKILPRETFVIYGSARGNTQTLETRLREITDARNQQRRISNMMKHVRGASLTSSSTIAPAVARHHRLEGLTLVVGSACTSSLTALKLAYDYVKNGETDTSLVGGAEAAVTLPMYLWFELAGLYAVGQEPATAVRPFCTTRNGTALSESGCTFLIEEEQHALKRGAKIYGELVAASTGIDVNNENFEAMTEDGSAYAKLMSMTINKACISAEEIDMVCAHAPGSKGDAIEIRALDKVFKDMHPPTVSFKSLLGHSIGNCAALEVAVALAAMQNAYIPPNYNIRDIEKIASNQNIPTAGINQSINYILKTGSGFGGYLGALVVRKYDKPK